MRPQIFARGGLAVRIQFRRPPFLAAQYLVLCMVMMFAANAAAAEGPSPADHTDIQAVIKRQLSAFSRDDAGAAFAIASPVIQRMFGNPANFLAMVKSGYPPLYRHRRAEFGELAVMNGELVQSVLVTGADGHQALALYAMIKDGTRAWRINGCRLLQKEELAA
jgi:hypothetical protein